MNTAYTVNSWQNYLKGRLQFSNGEMQFLLYRISPQSQKPGTAKAFRCKLSFVGKTQEFNQHSELLSQKAFSSLQIQCHPSLFKYGNCQGFQGKTYTDHVLIHRGLQSLGYADLLKVMVSFARYSQTSIFIVHSIQTTGML